MEIFEHKGNKFDLDFLKTVLSFCRKDEYTLEDLASEIIEESYNEIVSDLYGFILGCINSEVEKEIKLMIANLEKTKKANKSNFQIYELRDVKANKPYDCINIKSKLIKDVWVGAEIELMIKYRD